MRVLGKGGFAKVFLATDPERQEKVAVKVLKKNKIHKTQNFSAMLNEELEAMQAVNHASVIRIYKASKNGILTKPNKENKDVFYFEMEYGAGGLVYDYLFNTGAFPDHICKFYMCQLMSGVQAIHKAGFTHRDLKPENLLFDSDFNLKITDFGFSVSIAGRDASGLLETMLGTKSYMAPEI